MIILIAETILIGCGLCCQPAAVNGIFSLVHATVATGCVGHLKKHTPGVQGKAAASPLGDGRVMSRRQTRPIMKHE